MRMQPSAPARRSRTAGPVLVLLAVTVLAPVAALAQLPPADAPQQPLQLPLPPDTPLPPAPAPVTGLKRWLDPSTAPFIPVPEIGTDPNGGTTLGLLPVWLRTDANHEIDQIIAPDILHNTYFGYGVHGRIFAYPSEDEQWSVVAGIKERVEREFDLEYQVGRARRGPWSFNVSLIADRDGTPRFFGLGNRTVQADETNYTASQVLARVQAGWNISRIWQLAYTLRVRSVDVQPGTLPGIASIEQRFGDGVLGTNKDFLHRLALIYDTRDDLTMPRNGMQWIGYTGAASSGAFNDALYREAGIDGRIFCPVPFDTVLAAHVALRYLWADHGAPFWALSTIGGDRADVGGEQPLRGYGAGRYTDRDAYSTTLELRHTLFTLNAGSSHIEVELTPFVDAGRVFQDSGTFPLAHIHAIGGVGFRGIARPFVVGYVDVGYGDQGAAVFTGINYPF